MTQEDKELLLKDLCARLPYGVKGIVEDGIKVTTPSEWPVEKSIEFSMRYMVIKNEWRPYLFPMSSMTDEQKEELSNEMCYLTHSQIEGRNPNGLIESTVFEIDFYNKHHIDYRGFIEKGLAIDATNKNVY